MAIEGTETIGLPKILERSAEDRGLALPLILDRSRRRPSYWREDIEDATLIFGGIFYGLSLGLVDAALSFNPKVLVPERLCRTVSTRTSPNGKNPNIN